MGTRSRIKSCSIRFPVDVLLRHRLLRKPGGFEGFVSRSEAQDRSDHLSLLELVEVELASVYRYAARLAPALPMRCADHAVSRSRCTPRYRRAVCRRLDGPEAEVHAESPRRPQPTPADPGRSAESSSTASGANQLHRRPRSRPGSEPHWPVSPPPRSPATSPTPRARRLRGPSLDR